MLLLITRKLRTHFIDWYKNQRPWLTLNWPWTAIIIYMLCYITHILFGANCQPQSFHMLTHGPSSRLWRTVASLSHAVSAPHFWYPLVRLREKLISRRKDRFARPDQCGHRRQEAGSLLDTPDVCQKAHQRMMPSKRLLTVRRHDIRPWLEQKAR